MFSWWLTGTPFLFFIMRPQDLLVVDMWETLFYFWARDHEIFSWWICGTAFFIFTRRPRDFLMVDVHDNILFFTTRPQDFLVVGGCDNIFNFDHETTRLSRGGCVGQPSLVSQGDQEIFSWWMCMTTFNFSPRDLEIFSWWVCHVWQYF